MIGAFLALIAITILFLFVFPWVGIATGIAALALLVAWLAGFGKRAAREAPPAGPRQP